VVLRLVVDHGIDFVMTLLDQNFAFDTILRLLVLREEMLFIGIQMEDQV